MTCVWPWLAAADKGVRPSESARAGSAPLRRRADTTWEEESAGGRTRVSFSIQMTI